MTDPDMGTWSYAYDANDNLTSQTDAKSQTIRFTYDALNRVTLKDLPACPPTGCGGPAETDVTYQYDDVWTAFSKGRLTRVTDGSGLHSFEYDAQGRVVGDAKAMGTGGMAGYRFIRTYDALGRVRTLGYPDTEIVTYTYNGFGDVESIRGDTNGVITDYVKDVNYNASGQITFTKYGNNVTSSYAYDPNTLRLNNILTKKPDGVTKLQDLSYQFDPNGNVTRIADTVNSMSQTFTYDDLNRLLTATGSAYGSQTFTYDPLGNMTSKAGRTMAYGEGAPGPHAVTSVTWTGSTNYPTFCRDLASGNCTLGYDPNGNMARRGNDVLTYNSENQLKQMDEYEGKTGSQSYTLQPGWNLISFTYLPDNRSITNVLSSLTYGTDYDQVSTWISDPGSWIHYVNDPDFNDFTQFEYGRSYEIYNNSGVDKSLTVTGKTTGIDIAHNIISGDNFISPAVKTAMNVSTVLSGLTLGTHYSDVKRFNATTQSWESFAAGQFTQFEPGKGYNIVGLTSANFSYGKTETTTTFVYDSTGARVKKLAPQSPGGGTVTTIYLGKDYEIEGAGSTKHIFLGDRRITTKKSTGDIFFIHSDHINSSNVITDAAGNRSALLEYDPYGATVTHTGSAELKHRYTGQEADDTTKLYYYNFRYYDPQLGRFVSPDTIIPDASNPQEFNRYSYVNNNPIKFTDPTGHKKKGGFWKRLVSMFIGTLATAVTGGCIPCGMFAANVSYGAMTGGVKGALLGALSSLGAVGAGLSSKISGGSFMEGFIAGGIGNLVAMAPVPINFGNSGVGIFASEIASDFARGFASGTLSAAATGQSLRSSVNEGLYNGLFSVAYGQVNNAIGHTVGLATSGRLPEVKNGMFAYKSDLKVMSGGAITFGNAVTYGSDWDIFTAKASLGRGTANYTVWEHEKGHYVQGRALGVAYVPVHGASLLVGGLIGFARNQDSNGHHQYNLLERTFHSKPSYSSK